jgi:putative FmdB family regulatory protein
MPLYEYQCTKCGHRFERIQKFSDPPVKKCPECGGKVEQLLSAPAVQFKGSGWYVTDYARKGASKGDSVDESKSADAKSGDGKSGDKAAGEKSPSDKSGEKSKPEKKTEKK